MEFFVRQVKNQEKYDKFVNSIDKILNLQTITLFTAKKISKLYDENYEEEFLSYRFYLLKQWINKNEIFSKDYIDNLRSLIERLLLEDSLNGFELDYIDYYNQIVFSKNRNLKNLLVDFDILYKEEVFFKFDLEVFGQKRENEVDVLFHDGEIFISTQRIVASDVENYYSLFYDDITYIKLKNFCLEIQIKQNLTFWIFSQNIHAFYVSLERVLNIIKKRI